MDKNDNRPASLSRRDFITISVLSTSLLLPGVIYLLQKAARRLSPVISSLAPQTGGGWSKSKDNPVLGGSLGTCFDVSVLKESAIFRMWFSWRPKKSIALVESMDGIHWNEPLIVLGPEGTTGWEDSVNRPVVIKLGDGYSMWYTGQTQYKSYIGYATSTDGKIWKRMSRDPVLSPDVAWEGDAVMCPDVMYDPDRGLYRMWYSGGEQFEPIAIGFAQSPDGIHWTKNEANPIFTPDVHHTWEQDRVTASHAVWDGEWYILFYIGFSDVNHAQIGVARSKDGLSNWQRHKANPIIRPGYEAWDADAVYKPSTLFDDGKGMLWYNGRHGDVEQIGLATHPGQDLHF